MKIAISIILVISTLSLTAGLPNPETRPKITLLSTGIAQINTTPPIANTPKMPSAEPIEQWQTVQMRVTAYCPCSKCCGPSANWTTASGHKIQPGQALVATDKRYPFGTEMIIPSYNNNQPVKVLDRGGAIKGNRIDVFFTSHRQALNWGVQSLPVKILAE